MATSIGSLHYELTIDGKNISGELATYDRQVKQFSQTGKQEFDGFSALAGKAKFAALAVGAAAVSAGVAAVTSAADFEKSLNVLQQISGATNQQLDQMKNLAKDLGSDLTLPGVSASDAAGAMTELAKAGISVNDTMAASKGVLSLAKAGQLETAEAAQIAANALLAFKLEGKEANRVADLLAAAANASSADVHGLGLSLSQVSALAAQTKRPIEDVVTQIGLLANKGIQGSDAGTSLKTMLLALISPSKEASKLMGELGVKVYDNNGVMKSSRDIIDQFAKATNKLTNEQRDATLAQIFGSDAVRAASILISGGTAEYDKMSVAVTKTGAAQDLAAAQSKGFAGALEGLKSSAETLAAEYGEVLLPVLTDATNAVSGFLSGWADTMRGAKAESEATTPILKTNIDVLTQATELQKKAEEDLKAAQENLKKSEEQLVVQNDVLKTKHEDVTKATDDVRIATETYGAKSDQAREATEKLEEKQRILEQAMKDQFIAVGNVSQAKDGLSKSNEELTRRTEILHGWETQLKDLNFLLADSFGIVGDKILQPTQNIKDFQGALDITRDKVIKFNGQVGGLQSNMQKLQDIQGQFQFSTGLQGAGGTAPVKKPGSYARGVQNFEGGLAYVHKDELLVNLPKGSDVIPSDKMGRSINIKQLIINDRGDADYFLRRLDENHQLESLNISPMMGAP